MGCPATVKLSGSALTDLATHSPLSSPSQASSLHVNSITTNVKQASAS